MDRVQERELREAVVELLGVNASSEDALRQALGEPWSTQGSGRDELDHLLQLDTTFGEVEAGIVYVPSVLEGTAWTVWVDPDDAGEGFVRTHPYLSPLGWWLISDDVELLDADGGHVGVLKAAGWMLDGQDTDVVLGPDGWLDGLAGGWARVEVVGGGLRWSALVDPPAATPAQVAAIRAGFDRAVRVDTDDTAGIEPLPQGLRCATGDGPVHEAIIAGRRAFLDDPISPLPDLYAAAGLVQRDSTLAEDGFDWEALRVWRLRNRLRISYGLDHAQVVALSELLSGYDAWVGTGASSVPAAGSLDDGDVAAAWWVELTRRHVEFDDLARFTEEVLAASGPSIGTSWLRARLLDRRDDTAAALAGLEAVVDGGCTHGPALVDLAGLRADAGDSVAALRLLQRAGIGPGDGGDPRIAAELLWDEVEGFATHRPRPMARRNDPCPCGSDRKYKACHLGRETHSLDDRAGWLYLKAQRFLRDRHADAVADLVEIMVDPIDERRLFEQLVDAPFAADLVLHEDGVFAEFAAARDGLLPDDEALLAAQWSLVDRSAFEIVSTYADRLELRDLVSGEQITVVNTHPSDQTRPGMVMIGRPLPVADAHRAFSGFLPLPHGHLDAVLAALDTRDASEIADALSVLFEPPRLANTDGDELLAHTLTWRVPAAADVHEALVAAGLRAEEQGSWTLVRDSKNQRNTLIASVALDGDELTVEVNSHERADELRQLIGGALPDAELVDVDAVPFEIPSSSERAGRAEPLDQNDPAIQAILREYIAEAEQRWIDEEIPALAGRTPRQAAADPIGREELRRLLTSFPVPADDQPGAMNPDRLRSALGL